MIGLDKALLTRVSAIYLQHMHLSGRWSTICSCEYNRSGLEAPINRSHALLVHEHLSGREIVAQESVSTLSSKSLARVGVRLLRNSLYGLGGRREIVAQESVSS